MIGNLLNGLRVALWTSLIATGILTAAASPVLALGSERVNTKPRKLALLVGINQYKHSDKLSTLEGTENDVDAMRTLLTTKFGFSSEDVITLKGPQATRDAIINTFRSHLTSQATKGDIVLFHFSGHGSRMQDAGEPGGWDQTIVPYDSRDDAGKITDIRDKELNTLIRELSQKTDNITIVLDSCFSGTGIKGAEKVRTAPPDQRFGPNPPPSNLIVHARDADGSTSGLYSVDLRYVLIAASRSNQFSFEYYADNKEHGALTYFLTNELSKPSAARTYQEILDVVAQEVNGYYPMQSPQLEGPLRDHYVLDVGGQYMKPYVSVSSLSSSEVTLAAGQPESLTVGSVFDVYRSGSEFSNHRKPIAAVRLTSVEITHSTGKLISGTQIPAGAAAVERSHAFPPSKMKVFLEGLSSSQVLQDVRQSLIGQENNGTELLNNELGAQLVLEQRGSEILTKGPDGTELASRLSIGTADVAQLLKERVLAYVQWYLVLNAVSSSSNINVKFTCTSNDPTATQATNKIKNGTQVSCSIENHSAVTIYVYIMDLSSTNRYHLLYPPLGQTRNIDPRSPPLAIPNITMTVPGTLDQVQDILKLIVATDELKYLPLMQQDAKDAPQNLDPLEELFARAIGTRSRDATLNVPTDWTTKTVSFVVAK